MDRRDRFEALYREYAGVVWAFARRRVGDAAADDVVAEVFLTAWRRLDQMPAETVPWLLITARGVLSNARRGELRRQALRDRLATREPERGDADGWGWDRESPVTRALSALSERDREVLLLVAWDGLSREQAARVLGVRIGAFAVRLHRARARFTKALAAQDAVGLSDGTQPSTVEVSR